MKAMKRVYIFIIAIFLMGCSSGNKQELLVQELMETDLAFSEMSREEGMNSAFAAYCAENGVLLRPGSMPIVGSSEISALLNRNDDSSFELTWEPLHARVAESGDLGYTYGLYTIRLKTADTVSMGTYVSVWAKENGVWKWVLDTGNEGVGN